MRNRHTVFVKNASAAGIQALKHMHETLSAAANRTMRASASEQGTVSQSELVKVQQQAQPVPVCSGQSVMDI